MMNLTPVERDTISNKDYRQTDLENVYVNPADKTICIMDGDKAVEIKLPA